MKILMLHPHDIWGDEEPWTSRIRNIAREMIRLGHEVRVVYFAYRGHEHRVPKSDMFQSYKLSRRNRSIFYNIYAVTKHARWADVIHFQKCFAHASIPAIIAHIITNKPIHYDWDDWEIQIYNFAPPSKLQGKFLAYLENAMPYFVDTISVSSQHLRTLALQMGFPHHRIVDAHVCADLAVFRPGVDGQAIREKFHITKPVVMYMGQLHGGQYANVFIDAAALIVERGEKNVLFMVVGSGERERVLIHQAIERGVADKLIFTGAVAHEDIPRYLAVCDIAVACFEDNNITRCKSPLKVVEYMACGKAIVASDVGEVGRMLGGCGILTRPGDADAICQAVIDLLHNTTKRYALATMARQNAEKWFSWEVTANNILKAYEMAMTLYPSHTRA